MRDEQPALWVLEQDYTGPDGTARHRRGFLARVRVEEYGPGRIRPHERTHPGPREDRLRLTRATRANLSPIFSLFDDPIGRGHERADPRHRTRALGTGHRRRSNRQPAVAGHRSRLDRPDHRRGAISGAADRRWPPPLRDRARVRGGDRRRGAAPIRADVPRGAGGSGPDRVPHPPAAARSAPRPARDARPGDQARLRHPPAREHRRARPHLRTAGPSGLHRRPFPPAVHAHAEGPGDRRLPSCPITPSRTGGWTPRCSRR